MRLIMSRSICDIEKAKKKFQKSLFWAMSRQSENVRFLAK